MRVGVVTLCVSVLALSAGCAKPASDGFPGYAEADYVRLTAPIAGH